jgi:hypothetical protein
MLMVVLYTLWELVHCHEEDAQAVRHHAGHTRPRGGQQRIGAFVAVKKQH